MAQIETYGLGGDWNFTQLLEEGSNMNNELMMDSPQEEVHTLQFPPKVQMEYVKL